MERIRKLKEFFKDKRPLKKLGQNFLICRNILDKIVETAEITKEDTILEIGAGLGFLTEELAKKAKKVIAVEKDSRLIGYLKNNLPKNVTVKEKDILKMTPLKGDYKVAANLPYYITSPIIKKLLENNPPSLIVLTVQREIGERICAHPPQMSKLAVFTQFHSKPEIITKVPKSCFWPQPKVDSVILKLTPKKVKESKSFSRIVKAGFSHPRKQLVKNLSQNLEIDSKIVEKKLKELGINSKQRAETLSLKDWKSLVNLLE